MEDAEFAEFPPLPTKQSSTEPEVPDFDAGLLQLNGDFASQLEMESFFLPEVEERLEDFGPVSNEMDSAPGVLCSTPSATPEEIEAHVRFCRSLPPAEVLDMMAQSLFRTLHCVATAKRTASGVATCDQATFDYYYCQPVMPEDDYGIVFDRNSEDALARRFRPRDASRRRRHKRKREVPDLERKLVHWRNALTMARSSRAMLPIPSALHRVPTSFVTVTRVRDAVLARSPLGRYAYTNEDLLEEMEIVSQESSFATDTMDVFRRTLQLLQIRMGGGRQLPNHHKDLPILPTLWIPTQPLAKGEDSGESPESPNDVPISPTDPILPEGFEHDFESFCDPIQEGISELTLVDNTSDDSSKEESDEPGMTRSNSASDILVQIGSTVRQMLGWAQ